MLKYLFYSILILLLLNSCISNSNKFYINGYYDVDDNTRIDLLKTIDSRPTVVASTKVFGGKYSFEGTIDRPTLFTIHAKYKKEPVYLFVEPGDINIRTISGTYQDRTFVDGSKSHRLFESYLRIEKRFARKIDTLKSNYSFATQIRDTNTIENIEKTYVAQKKSIINSKINFIKKHNSSEVSLFFLLNELAYNIPTKQLKEIVNLLDPKLNDCEYFLELNKTINKLEKIEIGKIAPNFYAENQYGVESNLHEIIKKNKVIILDFWASWCGPCRGENHILKDLYEKYKQKGLEIVSFSLDVNKDFWKRAIREDQINWINLTDYKQWKSDVIKQYCIKAIPKKFIIDSQGKIIASDVSKDDVESIILKVLN